MKANVGTVDRAIRVFLGLAIFIAPLINFLGLGSSTLTAVISMTVGAVLVLTGLVSFCPLYAALGIKTRQT